MFSPECSEEILVLVAEAEFDVKNWAEVNQGKTLHDVHKAIIAKVKEERVKRKEPKPIPVEHQAKLRCLNDLRRYLYENSARERVWTKAGTVAIPKDLLEMNVTDILKWLKVWKEDVWENTINREDFGLKKCAKCGMVDKKDDEHGASSWLRRVSSIRVVYLYESMFR